MEIRTEDLFRKCTACGGDGVLSARRETGDAVPLTGEASGAATRCDRCDGKGMQLTDSGKVLRAFYQMLGDGKL